MSHRLWMSKPLKSAINLVSDDLQSDLWIHNFDSTYSENGNYTNYFSSLEELLNFEERVQHLLRSMFLMSKGDHLKTILDASGLDSWLHDFLRLAKQKLSSITYIKKYDEDNDKWESSEEETMELKQLIDEIINNLDSMNVMLVYNKANQEEGIDGKHYFWELRGHMSSLLMKLKAQGDFRDLLSV